MHPPATNAGTTQGTTPFITPASAPATSHEQHEHSHAPGCQPTRPPGLTNDFHLDTFFSPVWMPGPNVFSFAENGTVVRPREYGPEPYPGYHADRPRGPESVGTSHFQGFRGRDPKPWKNVAITEQDDAEYEAFKERMRTGAVGERGPYPPYGHAQRAASAEQPEYVYTWPPRSHGR